MQIVIDIPDNKYQWIQDNPLTYDNEYCEAIRKGAPLPKGHGELKDMGNLQYVFDLTREDPIYSGKDIVRAIKSMKSIIEADTESGDKNDILY